MSAVTDTEPAIAAPQSDAVELVKRAEEYLLGDDLTGSEVDRICELVVRLTAENAALRKDAERWRAFEEAGHLMITDFDRRESGTFKTTKRNAIDAAMKKEKP